MSKHKISEMVVDFAWDFIGQGNTIEERRNRLNSACSAWNYACVPEKVWTEQLDKYINDYQKWNPDADAKECQEVRKQMELLIQEKLKKYPHVIKQIVGCELIVVDGQERLNVMTISEHP